MLCHNRSSQAARNSRWQLRRRLLAVCSHSRHYLLPARLAVRLRTMSSCHIRLDLLVLPLARQPSLYARISCDVMSKRYERPEIRILAARTWQVLVYGRC